MRNPFLKIVLAGFILSFGACTHKTIVVTQKPLPPGQAKKVYGTKSAKPFAPGQQKKKH
ncbi:MAG: quinol oxidase subunit 4 [Verrucomicrobia bacterium]|nr:quinol oxidase subunit 4 [Cytophagales bacterium]